MSEQLSETCCGISLPLSKGPFQNNGASPWYATLTLGTAKPGTEIQQLKFSVDTGSNFVWVSSSLCVENECKENKCQHYGGDLFNYHNSSSFQFISQQPQMVDFGPWGEMQVELGEDVFHFIDNQPTQSELYLSRAFVDKDSQFKELDWDGGIGMPSYTIPTDGKSEHQAKAGHYGLRAVNKLEPSFHIMASLIEQQLVEAHMPYVAFETDGPSGEGSVSLGRLDRSYQTSREYLFLPWKESLIPSVSYLWSTQLESFALGDQILAKDADFILDSGSSQYKGDVEVMNAALKAVAKSPEELIITFGDTGETPNGELRIPASTYLVKIEAGQDEGQVQPQFKPMEGIPGLILTGSVLMDYLYTVYEYRVRHIAGKVALFPVGTWIFNKPGGLNIIQNRQSSPARIFTQNEEN
ncbi:MULTISPECIES: pepsin-like aspartic protease [unclassified Agarivorans]|uniref:pepsin-like aspartic protease n=1 Tax=unclassified Agarivorans TaxID=2636026 RepID=UPI003D7D5048